MKLYYHRFMCKYCDFRLFLLMQHVRLRCWWFSNTLLWEYNWKQIACALLAAKLRSDRDAGIEPAAKHLLILRHMEDDFKVKKAVI